VRCPREAYLKPTTDVIMRNNNMTEIPRYPFSDLTQPEVEAIIARARIERAVAIRNFFSFLFRGGSNRRAPVAEFAAGVPARVSPC
jgi:hypothetical protein